MELDDLKDAWKKNTSSSNLGNNNVMEIIKNKKYGPVSVLKNKFRNQLISLTIAIALFTYLLLQAGDIHGKTVFFLMISIWIGSALYFLYSYRLIRSLQGMEGMVKPNIEKIIMQLEKAVRWRVYGSSFIIAAAIAEIEFRIISGRGMEGWLHQAILLRLIVYIIAGILFYFFVKVDLNIRYGKHINFLKTLVGQMQ